VKGCGLNSRDLSEVRVLDCSVTISFAAYLVVVVTRLVMCGCFGNICTCMYCVLYCLYYVFVLFRLCIFILVCFVCASVRTTATE
jgi:hypothetical protein